MLLFQLFLAFLLGSAVASFGNVLISRLPREETIWGRSYCPNCRRTLSPLDLIPVFSYLFLKGRCRYCGNPIGIGHLLSEIFFGCLYGLTAYFTGGMYNLEFYYYAVLFFSLYVLAGIDLFYMEIPIRLTVVFFFIGLVLVGILHGIKGLINGYIGLTVGAGTLYLADTVYTALRGKFGIGEGDWDAMGLASLYFVPVIGLKAVYFLVLFSAVAGILLAFVLRSRKIPFIPAIFTGSIALFLCNSLHLI